MLVEDAVQSGVLLVLRARGRHHPLIVPFIGYGTADRVRVGARVVHGRAAAAPAVGFAAAAPPTARSRRAVLRAGLARFLTVEVAGAVVTVTGGGTVGEVRSDRDGYVDAVLDVEGLAPGWHEFVLRLADGASASAQVLVVDPAARTALVSDVDDTILETGLSRGLEFLRITLLTEVHERTPLPGAAPLYRALGTPVFYVSTSPWNLHEMLLEFVVLRGFPLGPLLLTDWGPTPGARSIRGLFRIGAQAHKLGVVGRLLDEHPQLGLVLIGDSGQRDPEIYATLARTSPERIRAIYIRRTPHPRPGRIAEVDALAAAVTAEGVPMLAVDDSVAIAEHLAGLGLLDEAALAEVRSA